MRTFEQIEAEWKSPVTLPVGASSKEILQAYANKCAKTQAELLCLPCWGFDVVRLSIAVSRDLKDYEEDAKKFGIDLWEGHVIDG